MVLVTDSVGNELTPEQQDYFEDSVVRDENGKISKLYITERLLILMFLI